jgi:hypothetical protein
LFPSRPPHDVLSVLGAFDAAPVIGRGCVAGRQVSEAKQIRPAIFAGATPTGPCQFDKAERAHFTKSGADGVAMNAEFLKIIEGGGELAIVPASMIEVFDFKAQQDAMPGETEDLHRWRFQHFHFTRDKLPDYFFMTAHAHLRFA